MAMKSCNNHPSREAVLHCSQCHKPVCQNCVVNGRFCSETCNARFTQFYDRYKGGPVNRTTLLQRLAMTAMSLAILAGGAYFLLRHLGLWPPWRR